MITPNTAYDIFVKFVDKNYTTKITEFDALYIINNGEEGDFSDEWYVIDKETGDIREGSILDVINQDREPVIYDFAK